MLCREKILSALVFAAVSACGGGAAPAINTAPSTKPLSGAKGTPPPTGTSADATPPPREEEQLQLPDREGEKLPTDDKSLVDATYSIKSEAAGITVCEGEIQIKVAAKLPTDPTAQLFEIPRGTLDCTLVGKIDLVQMLGAFSNQAGAPPPTVKKPVVVDNGIIALKAIGPTVYSPARPLLVNFLAASKSRKERDKIGSINKTISVTAKDTKANKQATGQCGIQVLGVGGTRYVQKMGKDFKNVVEFVITSDFDGDQIDVVNNFLFDRMRFVVALDPLAVLHIEFDGYASDFMAVAGKTAGDGFLGSLMKLGQGGIAGAITNLVTKIIPVHTEIELMASDGIDFKVKKQNLTDD